MHPLPHNRPKGQWRAFLPAAVALQREAPLPVAPVPRSGFLPFLLVPVPVLPRESPAFSRSAAATGQVLPEQVSVIRV